MGVAARPNGSRQGQRPQQDRRARGSRVLGGTMRSCGNPGLVAAGASGRTACVSPSPSLLRRSIEYGVTHPFGRRATAGSFGEPANRARAPPPRPCSTGVNFLACFSTKKLRGCLSAASAARRRAPGMRRGWTALPGASSDRTPLPAHRDRPSSRRPCLSAGPLQLAASPRRRPREVRIVLCPRECGFTAPPARRSLRPWAS